MTRHCQRQPDHLAHKDVECSRRAWRERMARPPPSRPPPTTASVRAAFRRGARQARLGPLVGGNRSLVHSEQSRSGEPPAHPSRAGAGIAGQTAAEAERWGLGRRGRGDEAPPRARKPAGEHASAFSKARPPSRRARGPASGDDRPTDAPARKPGPPPVPPTAPPPSAASAAEEADGTIQQAEEGRQPLVPPNPLTANERTGRSPRRNRAAPAARPGPSDRRNRSRAQPTAAIRDAQRPATEGTPRRACPQTGANVAASAAPLRPRPRRPAAPARRPGLEGRAEEVSEAARSRRLTTGAGAKTQGHVQRRTSGWSPPPRPPGAADPAVVGAARSASGQCGAAAAAATIGLAATAFTPPLKPLPGLAQRHRPARYRRGKVDTEAEPLARRRVAPRACCFPARGVWVRAPPSRCAPHDYRRPRRRTQLL